jgi:hypothetical protein
MPLIHRELIKRGGDGADDGKNRNADGRTVTVGLVAAGYWAGRRRGYQQGAAEAADQTRTTQDGERFQGPVEAR